MAKLYFRYGAMNSGKSSYLLQAAYNYESSGQNVLLAKPDVDIKSGMQISSRIGISRAIDFIILHDTNVFQEFNDYNQKNLELTGENVACLLVDESQFLSRHQVDQLLKIATFINIPVMCFGIRSDFMTNGFEGSDRLLQVAHSIEEMKTICGSCGHGKATLNARKVNGEYVFDGEQVAIDVGSDVTVKRQHAVVSYSSLCSACYLKHSKGKLG